MIRRITLKCTPVETSTLGFGCASLTMLDDTRKAIALLDEAFDLGITHFDVAPLYGFGQCEGIVGEFLRGKRDRVTVATKFGLAPAPAIAKQRRLVKALRWASHRLPRAASLARRFMRGKMAEARVYSPSDAAKSLENSLRELGTDYVDVFLLHEGTLADAARPDLAEWLNRQMEVGTIRSFGVAASYAKLHGAGLQSDPARAILQFDSSALSRNVSKIPRSTDRGLVTFGAVSGATPLAALARRDGGIAKRYREAVGEDLTQSGAVAKLMLRSALEQNSEGVVLFATTKADNLRANVRGVERVTNPEALRAFEAFATEAAARLQARS